MRFLVCLLAELLGLISGDRVKNYKILCGCGASVSWNVKAALQVT